MEPVRMTVDCLTALTAAHRRGLLVGRDGIATEVAPLELLLAPGAEVIATYLVGQNKTATLDEQEIWVVHDIEKPFVMLSSDPDGPIRAWRIVLEAIGMRRVEEVPIEIVPEPGEIVMPEYPWGLAPGNRVEVTWLDRKTRATVIRTSASHVELQPDDAQEKIHHPVFLDLIQHVTVLEEGEAGRALRERMANYARWLAESLEIQIEVPVVDAAEYVAALSAAFPSGIVVEFPEKEA